MNISWLSNFAQSWTDRLAHGRSPHAVLLTGSAGVGKRAAATWIAAQRLGIGTPADLPAYPVEALAHADLHWIAPLDDKEAIGIAQIRDLVAEFKHPALYLSEGRLVTSPTSTHSNNSLRAS